MRIEHSVGRYETVAVEVVVGGVVVVVVAAVGVLKRAVGAAAVQRLVDKVPNEAALQLRIFANQVPILLETAARVAHRVRVFALNERTVGLRVVGVALHCAIIGIHRAKNIGKLLKTSRFVLYWAARLAFLEPLVARFEILARPCFVAHRKEDYRGVVFVRFKSPLIALKVRLLVFFVVRQAAVCVNQSVRFKVGFAHHIKAVAVAEFVPVRVVGIVAGAHRIHVHLLHNQHVLLHPPARNTVTVVGVKFVAVDALDENGLAVHPNLSQIGFLLNFAEADTLSNRLKNSVFIVENGDFERIEIRFFGRPFFHCAALLRKREGVLALRLQIGRKYLIVSAIE